MGVVKDILGVGITLVLIVYLGAMLILGVKALLTKKS